MKNMMCRCLLLNAVAFLCFAGTPEQQGHLKKVSFIPLWLPQAQFAGYYVACAKGIYTNHGLDVTILQGGPQTPAVSLLKSGKADFGILWLSGAIKERSRGTPLVNIAQVSQRSALMLIARKSSGIQTPSDLNGKKVSLWEGDLDIQPKAFFKKYDLHVRTIPQTSSINLFLRGGVDVISGMWYNEYHTILNSGINDTELTTFFYDQYGLNFPEDGLYAMGNGAGKDTALCRAFVEASREGWLYAFSHEEEALDIILPQMKAAKIPANRTHQRWMLQKMKQLMMSKEGAFFTGRLNPDEYQRVASELKKNGETKTIPPFGQFYKPVLHQ